MCQRLETHQVVSLETTCTGQFGSVSRAATHDRPPYENTFSILVFLYLFFFSLLCIPPHASLQPFFLNGHSHEILISEKNFTSVYVLNVYMCFLHKKSKFLSLTPQNQLLLPWGAVSPVESVWSSSMDMLCEWNLNLDVGL